MNGNVINLWSSSTGGVTNVYQYDELNRLTNVVGQVSSLVQYSYDAVGNLQTMRYGNGVTSQNQYDSLNRLTNMVWKLNAGTLASFYYQLGLTDNRTNLSETVNGTSRTYAWNYDPLYRLTNEIITLNSQPSSLNYGYDLVGNRTGRTVMGSLSLTNQSFTFNTNDWLTTDQYDANGNTINASGNSYQYDALNHVTNVNSAIFITYDGDGNRVKKTAGGVTTYYLVDDRNPSGYAQVLEEWTTSGGVTNLSRIYNYGLSLVSQKQGGTTYYFICDGHGSTRALFDGGGSFVNSFAYDAFGNMIASNSIPQTSYLYTCQQWDIDLGCYYLRARTYNPSTGRFPTADSHEGNNQDPLSLHKYLYGWDNPVNRIDPTGKWATFIHKIAVNSALVTSLLPANDRQILCDQQDAVDSDQAAADSYRHAMSNGSGTPPQSPAAARQQANDYVRDLLTKARTAESKNDHTTAMQELGQAMHALQDSTSPAHHGFQPWYDYAGGAANPHEWCHGAKESINPGQGSWLYIATDEAYDYFHDASKPLPSDFFNDLGADSTGTGIKRWFNPFMDIIPDANISFTISDIGGFAF